MIPRERSGPLVISLDYDDTYTADPELWDAFIASAEHKGHEVVVISFRFEEQMTEVRKALPNLKVYGTNGVLKREWCDLNGIWVDIWIDDLPGTIT